MPVLYSSRLERVILQHIYLLLYEIAMIEVVTYLRRYIEQSGVFHLTRKK
jgi:hypothetical protein